MRLLWLGLLAITTATLHGAELDLTGATVVVGEHASRLEKKAAEVLVEEVARRSWVQWRVASTVPAGAAAAIELTRRTGPREGYRLTAAPRGAMAGVTIAGNDERGVLYGVGALLQSLRIERERVSLPGPLDVETAPKLALRGHQLGYRPKTNAYDGWNVAMWEQYIRDLALFGANAIELIPPRSDDDADSPHFPLPPLRMMQEMSRIAGEYGMDVWVWYPALDKDYSDPKTVEAALAEWSGVLKTLPHLDAVFVPGGDPGHTPPAVLMPFLEKQAANIRRYHPKAQMWLSPQGFDRKWMEEFYSFLAGEPAWLTGIVHGPQVRDSLAVMRKRAPARYPIRNYPDITHSLHCQYPVPDWDAAYAVTLGRETINPRPVDEAVIFRGAYKDTIGFISYSEGCNDDVNKFLWSALAWNPEADVTEVLRNYARYFIGARHADSFAQGLLALERNWRGPLAANAGVLTTARQFRALDEAASPQELANWRFQQAIYRANYDAYVRSRLIYENALEAQATAILANAARLGSLPAMAEAERVLARADTAPIRPDLRQRVFEMAEALFQSIRMQLSVPKYKAIEMSRGANLDAIDEPLNNRGWLLARFAGIRALTDEAARLKGIDEIVNWTNPGPGGYYDDLGDPANEPHLVKGSGFAEDPTYASTAVTGFGNEGQAEMQWRKSTWTYAEALREAPLELRYTGLDPGASYRVRIVYAGERGPVEIRLVANDRFEIHPFQKKEFPPRPKEFEIPSEATAGGALSLKWYGTPGRGGSGRGNQVAEVWLIKQNGNLGKTR
ncbi:MAG: glycoside hydrolase family 20 zincin-like fold domain-containing protein [Bryobacteraceae bacterium]|nr:glycoside hydrolase family 20 zincin-like fold domain-containing protein [Bryobacteraceae bacterium]